MALPDSLLAYQDCIDLFDKALDSPTGIRIGQESERAAKHMRHRMHKARSLDQAKNRIAYKDDPESPMFGRSEYDKLYISIEEVKGKVWLYIRIRDVNTFEIEPINPDDPEIQAEKVATKEEALQAINAIANVTRRV